MVRGRPPIDFASKMTPFFSPFPAEDVEEIAARFGFAPNFPLKRALDNQVAMPYRILAGRRTPGRAERRRRLGLIEQEARAVWGGQLDRQAALARLLEHGWGALPGLLLDPDAELWSDPPPERVTFSLKQLGRIIQEVKTMRTELPPATRGPEPRTRLVVLRCGEIWSAGTGRRPTATKALVPLSEEPWERHELRGHFVDFLDEVAKRIGLERSREALWKAWERSRKS